MRVRRWVSATLERRDVDRLEDLRQRRIEIEDMLFEHTREMRMQGLGYLIGIDTGGVWTTPTHSPPARNPPDSMVRLTRNQLSNVALCLPSTLYQEIFDVRVECVG